MVLAKAELTDEEIVKLVSAGGTHHFEILMNRYAGRIYGTAIRMLSNVADAEDVLQEVFLSAFSKLDSFRSESRFSTWLFTVALNTIYIRLRKRKAAAEEDEDIEGVEKIDSASMTSNVPGNPEEEILHSQALDGLRNAILLLPDEQRIVLIARDIEGLTAEQTAEALGITIAAVKSRLHRARFFLRSRLSRHFS